MAKPRSIPGIDEDGPFATAAARVVEVRAAELAANAHGVLDTGEIEHLHDMRVATRRLRAALEVFEECFPRKRFRRALREIKTLADALGERRDRDVTLVELERFAAEASAPDRPGVRSLIAEIEREQALANEALVPHVSPDRVEALTERLESLVSAARATAGQPHAAAPSVGSPAPAPARAATGSRNGNDAQ